MISRRQSTFFVFDETARFSLNLVIGAIKTSFEQRRLAALPQLLGQAAANNRNNRPSPPTPTTSSGGQQQSR